MLQTVAEMHVVPLVLALVGAEPQDARSLTRAVCERSGHRLRFDDAFLRAALRRLECDGVLRGTYTSVGRKPAIKVYSLTDRGRKCLAESRADWCAYAAAVDSLLSAVSDGD
jgi:Predicted transcriptional regulators